MKKFSFPQTNLFRGLLGLTALLAISITCMNISEPPQDMQKPATATDAPPADLHKNYDILLRLYVDGTRFDYEELFRNEADVKRLSDYVDRLESLNPENWEFNDALAYWINLYNAATLELILKNYPLGSIKDIGGLFSSPWKEDVVMVAGEALNLDEIENEIIRKQFKDARIHFAVNCASISCPPLANFAFTGEKLDEQLNTVCKNVFDNDLWLQVTSTERWIEVKEKEIRISKIFDWYKQDFIEYSGSVRKFLAQYRPQDAEHILNPKVKIKHMGYNWDLNKAEKATASK